MPNIQIRCPKCGSTEITKNKNQEYTCSNCQKIFYYVTPNTHNEQNPERYNL